MRVVSFMNYKGGVGKTTIAANIGAGLAQRGHKVLMLDLDPQTNLTFSFYTPEKWDAEIRADQTIKRWFDAHLTNPGKVPRLSDLIVSPQVNRFITAANGKLDLISSELGLLDIDMRLAAKLYSNDPHQAKIQRLRLHRMLADSLEDEELASYDFVLIDCAPDFGIVTRIAMVASNFIIVPAKPDQLSTLGISHFVGGLNDLVREHNGLTPTVEKINPKHLGIVFTMVQVYADKPTSVQQNIISSTAERTKLPIFNSMIRTANRMAISSAESGTPAVLGAGNDSDIVVELNALTDEFLERIRSAK